MKTILLTIASLSFLNASAAGAVETLFSAKGVVVRKSGSDLVKEVEGGPCSIEVVREASGQWVANYTGSELMASCSAPLVRGDEGFAGFLAESIEEGAETLTLIGEVPVRTRIKLFGNRWSGDRLVEATQATTVIGLAVSNLATEVCRLDP